MSDLDATSPHINPVDPCVDQNSGMFLNRRVMKENNISIAFDITELWCLAAGRFLGDAGAHRGVNLRSRDVSIGVDIGASVQCRQQMVCKQPVAFSFDGLL